MKFGITKYFLSSKDVNNCWVIGLVGTYVVVAVQVEAF